jgi:protein-S-isoprenylcysteine O-methyltransferase Ste14
MPSRPANQGLRIRILQLGAVLFLVSFMTMNPAFSQDGSSRIEYLGVCLVLFCVAGRTWSILYIGDKKNRELVTVGPYSMTRNPLYFFSMVGVLGIGLFIGSVVLALLLAVLVYLVLITTAGSEAAYLEEVFGQRYRDYAQRTPGFWPKPSLYQDVNQVSFSPAALKRTFRDGMIFIAALPVIELLEIVKENHFVPVLFDLF